jgi:AcrR family transcriptional regulator
MARKPPSSSGAPPAASSGESGPAGSSEPSASSHRERIIDAFMELLGEQPFEEIGYGAIAKRAGVSLAQLRENFSSAHAILAAYVAGVDRQLLSGGDSDMAEESPRERLFDVLMRRIELLESRKASVRSLLRSCRRDPGLALFLNRLAVRSQAWMLAAADIDASGPRGMIRAQGLALLYSSVLRVWLGDEDPGRARTMAALDRALARGQRVSGFLDDLCSIPRCLGRGRRRRRRYDTGESDEAAIAV